jgi:hypothetical protein
MASTALNEVIALSPPPVLLGLALHRRASGVLHLKPVGRTAGAVAGAEPLRNDPFQTHLAGVLKHCQTAIVFDVLIEADAVSGLAQDTGQCGLAGLYRLAAQIGTVEFE